MSETADDIARSGAVLPGDAIPIIDCDVHPSAHSRPVEKYIPAEFREALRQGMGTQPGQGYQNPFGVQRRDAACDDPEQTGRDLLDRYGMAYGVLQPPGLSASLSVNIDAGSAKARAWNDWQAAEWMDEDDRYLGSICVNVNDPEEAAREVRRAKALHPRFAQVVVGGESCDLYGHRRYYPIYEACAEYGLPFALHPGTEGALRSSTPVGRPSGYFEWHTSIPLTFQAHVISMVTEGVFEKFPSLKLVLVEGGVAWLAHTMWRLDKNFKSLRSTTPWLKRTPSEYIVEHVRLTTQPLEEPQNPEHLLQVFDMISAERTVCFASDFPHWDFDDPRRVFPRQMDPDLRRRILYDNAAELYGLPSLEETRARMAAKG
ncbi:MAG TPA: amidohydrolase family protein [Armatimonadaceae bacterium]|nr:amidohydrolase family protein [Armatimonadaceae bacterium]